MLQIWQHWNQSPPPIPYSVPARLGYGGLALSLETGSCRLRRSRQGHPFTSR